ncbi:MAG: short chain enoyl-CoA hydratase [Microvirga sp.]|jgi:enoyl-CoA hydratase/carnithine racemase|nr:short chain enoyl-CoA hydratase [Microvirga sp.]
MPDVLLVERKDGAAILTLNRPAAGNSVNAELSAALDEALPRLASDKSLRVLIVQGAGGRFFCTGGDIKEYRGLTDPQDVERIFGRTRRVLDLIEDFPVPTIAAVEGHALGGGAEIVLACDLALAGDTARFGLPQVRLGIVPGWNGIERLVRRCGRPAALRMVAGGEPVDAEGARRLGLIQEVVPAGQALDAALALAASFSKAAPLALRQAKRLVAAADAARSDASRAQAAAAFVELWFSADHREAEAAFAEKRPPVFARA